MKKQKVKIKVKGQGKVGRVLLSQVVPFALMLVMASVLTLWAGNQIDSHRYQQIASSQVSSPQHF